jgi:hypothetical protein
MRAARTAPSVNRMQRGGNLAGGVSFTRRPPVGLPRCDLLFEAPGIEPESIWASSRDTFECTKWGYRQNPVLGRDSPGVSQ